ncbi:MAG: tRNA threonylcarbamoyladenosine dehydratase [Chitinophagaceae bacterium]
MNTIPKWLERTALLVSDKGIDTLKNKHVLIVGLGGVGSFAAEFIARSGVGHMTIVDGDTVDITNTNRQLQAMHSTVGVSKAEWLEKRIRDINPEINLISINQFINPEETIALVNSQPFEYVLDCIDSITPKLLLIKAAKAKGCKIISSMGAGGKVDPTRIQYADLSKTHMCPFAFYIRKRLRKEEVFDNVMTVFSDEPPARESIKETDGTNYKRSFYGTISYIPALFGLYMASWVIQDALGIFKYTAACKPKPRKK